MVAKRGYESAGNLKFRKRILVGLRCSAALNSGRSSSSALPRDYFFSFSSFSFFVVVGDDFAVGVDGDLGFLAVFFDVGFVGHFVVGVFGFFAAGDFATGCQGLEGGLHGFGHGGEFHVLFGALVFAFGREREFIFASALFDGEFVNRFAVVVRFLDGFDFGSGGVFRERIARGLGHFVHGNGFFLFFAGEGGGGEQGQSGHGGDDVFRFHIING